MHHDPVDAEDAQQGGEDADDYDVPPGDVFPGFMLVKKIDDLGGNQGPGAEHELIVPECGVRVSRCKIDEHVRDSAGGALKAGQLMECTLKTEACESVDEVIYNSDNYYYRYVPDRLFPCVSHRTIIV